MWRSRIKDDMVVAVVGCEDSTTLSRKWPQGWQQGKPVIPRAPMACCHREAYRSCSPPEPSVEGVAGEETIPVEDEDVVREGDDQAPDNGEDNGDELVMSRAPAVVATRRDSRAGMAACLRSTGQRKKCRSYQEEPR